MLQEGTIVPVPKKAKVTELNYYRPVALTVPSKLVIKLETLGLDPALCNWVLDFLTGRPQGGEGR